jgi:hypothetical protein
METCMGYSPGCAVGRFHTRLGTGQPANNSGFHPRFDGRQFGGDPHVEDDISLAISRKICGMIYG